MYGGQELAGLIVEFMGNPAALGFLRLQELLGEALQPRPPGLHFRVELGIREGRGGVGGKEPRHRQGLGIEGPTRRVREAEHADHLAVMQEWQSQHRAHRDTLKAGADGGREGETRIGEDIGRDHGVAGTGGQPHHPYPERQRAPGRRRESEVVRRGERDQHPSRGIELIQGRRAGLQEPADMVHHPLPDLCGIQRLGQEMADVGQTFRGLPAPLRRGIEPRIVQGNRGQVGQPLQEGLLRVGEHTRLCGAHVE